ncbi:hypothetical protein SAMN05216412_11255 [Nitrosospira multiformis]|uniref:Uncharacterized protein n=1 Tax=Nitrosospira multiformis TaxID=1231 RepID=A0A1I0GAE3_9PROT|nr:hypothetical protein SAMN05216412_11255 [Nitrosospira multiformis]
MKNKQRGSNQLYLPLPNPEKLQDEAINIVSERRNSTSVLNFPNKRTSTFRERVIQDLIRNRVIVE